MVRIAFLFYVMFLTGCGAHRQIVVFEGNVVGNINNNITIQDNRIAITKETQIDDMIMGGPAKYYGDKSFSPNKIELLKGLLTKNLKHKQTINLVINKFNTIEYFPSDGKVNENSEQFKGLLPMLFEAMTENLYSIGHAGNKFVVKIEGEINNTPFTVNESFSYSDIIFDEKPADNPEYRFRINKVLNVSAQEIYKNAF